MTGLMIMDGMNILMRRSSTDLMMTFITTITMMTGKMMRTMTVTGTITKRTVKETKRTNTEIRIGNNNSKIKRTNIGTNKMKKTGTTEPEVIEFNTVTKMINNGTYKTNIMMTSIDKMTNKINIMTTSIDKMTDNMMKLGNIIWTGNARHARSVTNMIIFVEREAISNKDIETGGNNTINA